jgi:hypothetical protein
LKIPIVIVSELKLNYLMITITHISYAVSVASQFLEVPRVPHWDVIIHTVCYLSRVSGLGIRYERNGYNKIEGFTNTDWIGSLLDRRSNIGYCTFLGGNDSHNN